MEEAVLQKTLIRSSQRHDQGHTWTSACDSQMVQMINSNWDILPHWILSMPPDYSHRRFLESGTQGFELELPRLLLFPIGYYVNGWLWRLLSNHYSWKTLHLCLHSCCHGELIPIMRTWVVVFLFFIAISKGIKSTNIFIIFNVIFQGIFAVFVPAIFRKVSAGRVQSDSYQALAGHQ